MIRKLALVGGNTIKVIGMIILGITGLAGTIINIMVVNEAIGLGFLGIFLALFFFPITLTIAPWFALIAWGNPMPIIVTYGGFIVGAIVFGIGIALAGDD